MNDIQRPIFAILVLSLLFTTNLFAQFNHPTLIQSNTGLITDVITADINNDSLADLIVIKKFSTNALISYYLNQGSLNFGPEVSIATGNGQVTNISVGDFNNDNWLDIASIGDASNTVTLYLNNALTFTPQILDTLNFFESDINVTDIDNDNSLDIVAIGGTTFKVYYNDGMANFTSQTITGPIEDFFDITVDDIDGDGFQDVITGGSNLSIYKNTNGILSYDSIRSSHLGIITSGTFSLFVRLADLDNDGDLDLFREGDNSTGVLWMENDSNGNFTISHIIDSNVSNIRSGTINDFDNDNDLDFIIIKDYNLYLYTNDGMGNFNSPILIQDAPTTISVVHSDDLNNNGWVDLIWSADLSIQENNLTLSSQEKTVNALSISIYPNPSANNLYLKSPQDGILDIHNLTGQYIHQNISLAEGVNHLSLDLNPQVYFFKVHLNSGHTISKKVIIH